MRMRAGDLTPRSQESAETDNIAVSVILPAYNEEEALPLVLASLFGILGPDAEVIVVDDASTDATMRVAIAHMVRAKMAPCGYRLIQHTVNRGKGAAVRTGLQAARGKFIVVMDADSTYPPEAIPRMVGLAQRHDFIRCVRVNGGENMPPVNRLGNKIFDRLLKVIHGLEGTDHLSGLYGLRRDALEKLNIRANRFDLEVEIGVKARAHGLPSITLPIHYSERLGKKKLRPYRDGWLILRHLLSMALLYRPGLTFVTPGLTILGLMTVVCGVLSFSPSATGLGHTTARMLLVIAVAASLGFQLVTFGTAAGLCSMQRGASPATWLRAFVHPVTRISVATVGSLMLAAGVMLTTAAAVWDGGDLRTGRMLDFGVVLVAWGVQVFVAAAFTSLLAREMNPGDRGNSTLVEEWAVPLHHHLSITEETPS